MTESWSNDRFGIYVHWPFCQAICPYCAFNRVLFRNIDDAVWRAAYVGQIASSFDQTGPRKCTSVYFGGGTPSLMSPATVGAILGRIDEAYDLDHNAEITLEANPTSSEAQKFKDFRHAGINRLSIGVQSLCEASLAALGRTHTVDQAMAAYEAARAAFDNVSIDLIFGRQHQSPSQWRSELDEALAWDAPHMSLYQLTLEPGTAFARRHRRQRLEGLPDEDQLADMHLVTSELCEGAGYQHYEVSNFARPGAEARHNLLYWRSLEWLGLGPGAHGRIDLEDGRYATVAITSPEVWLSEVRASASGEMRRQRLPAHEVATEYMLMSLRLAEGMQHDHYLSLGGKAINPLLLAELTADGLVECQRGRIRVTARGRMLLNTVTRLLAGQ